MLGETPDKILAPSDTAKTDPSIGRVFASPDRQAKAGRPALGRRADAENG